MGTEVEKLFNEILEKYEREARASIEDNLIGTPRYEEEMKRLEEEIKVYKERYYNLWWR